MSANLEPSRRTVRARALDKSGFTLIEVLVAFAVMATLLSVLFRGVVGVRAGAMSFEDHARRDLVAQAVLNDALGKRTFANGTYSGMREGFRWTLVAKRIDLSAQMPPPAEPDSQPGDSSRATPATGAQAPAETQAKGKEDKPKWATQRLKVSVQGAGRPLEIETIRLVKAE